MPVVIHNRAADEDTVSILGQWFDGTVVLHCFSSVDASPRGRRARLVRLVRRQRHLAERRMTFVKRRAPYLPSCILAETDCPYLAPQPVRGKTNEPAYVVHTVAVARRGPRGRRGRTRAPDRRERRRRLRTTVSVRAKKKLGQHFLVDENILGVIGRLADLESENVVLEIGPGLGILTAYLADRVCRVYTVELDASLGPKLD